MKKIKPLIVGLIVFSCLIDSLSGQCIQGQNCPNGQGFCMGTNCMCKGDFETVLDESLPLDQQIYCNYEKTSKFTVLMLELLVPSFGHFYSGNYFKGILKFLIVVSFIFFSLVHNGSLKMPGFVVAILKHFASNLIPDEVAQVAEDTKDDQLIGGLSQTLTRTIEMAKKNDKEKKDENENKDGQETKEDAETKAGEEKGEEEKVDEEAPKINLKTVVMVKQKFDDLKAKIGLEKKTVQSLFNISSTVFGITYIADLLLYYFDIYTDGGGFALV